MSTNNKVFQVLVTKGNQEALEVGGSVEDLAVGQIGVFDAETNLAIDATSKAKEVYIAVGVDNDADTVVDEVRFSAGQSIQTNYMRNISLQDYVAPVKFSFELGAFKALNDMSYALKMEFRNLQIYMRQGTNQFTKTYAYTTSANEDVEPTLDLAKGLLAELNNDESGMFTASAYTAAGVAIPDLDAWGALNPGVAPQIRVVANELEILKYFQINPRFYYPRQTVIIPSLVDGFTSEATLTVKSEGVAEQGNAYDIKNKEYKAGGFNGKPGPYRTSSHLGFPYEGFSYVAVDGEHYMQYNLVYDFYSTAGWSEYLSNLMTTIAIPTADNITQNNVATILNGLFGTALDVPSLT